MSLHSGILLRSIRDKEALQQSEERFRKVKLKWWTNGYGEQDEDGCYTYSSDAVIKILGLHQKILLVKIILLY
jgi:PAS domain-containing protein